LNEWRFAKPSAAWMAEPGKCGIAAASIHSRLM
jgi:hypothetical protein